MEIIKFNKKIYNKKAIERAITEFEKLASFSINELNDYFEVRIDKIDQEVQNILKDEFANYVLGVMS